MSAPVFVMGDVHGAYEKLCRVLREAGAAGLQPAQVTGPFIYAGGRCVNLDSCMYRGGPGFIWQMD